VTNENIKTTTVEEESDLKKAINNVYESTIYIEVSGNRGVISSGSGFVYKEDEKYGYILTNYHVIDGGNKFNVTFTDGSDADAELISGDEYYDIAVLKVSKDKIKSVSTIGNSSNLELGDTLFTVGAPLGKEYMGTITKGIVSGINRMVSVELGSGSYLMEVIQTDAPINSGNSGGPICNIRGEVVGITSSKLAGTGIEGMGFAIPINSVMDVIENIETGKEIVRPYLGVQLVDLTNTFALQYYYGIKIGSDVEFGAVLSYVEEKKPADKAGLKAGDVIVEIDGEKVDDVSHFKYVLYKHKVGDTIKVKYYRENKMKETTIVLSEAIESN
jgi:serine protease Do